ncbi:MAG: glycosyltransferase family A protein [Verrucomicrobia bacterium]|nr:glycosyltransferase family A protein [Verrucomicrobiota bacterium]MDA1088580.1 glycosyltransferase family A protein [Verrucomicrobiota bacterium]
MSSSRNTVSVVIPAYNAEGTILEALQSVSAQTVAPFEVIVVDDVSQDATLRTIQESGSTCRLIERSENGGPASARNEGIGASSGEWIAFLDGDDAWLPWRLDLQLRLAEAHPSVAAWCGETIGLEDGVDDPHQPGDMDPASDLIELNEFVRHNPVATSTVLVKKSVLDEVGGFDPSFRGPEDFDLWMRIAATHEIRRVEWPISRYRVHVGSLSMDDRTFLPQVLNVLDKAYSDGGAMTSHPEWRIGAESNQYWNASWMAFNRGSRSDAVRLWWKAYTRNRKAENAIPRQWVRLLVRYLVGSREV